MLSDAADIDRLPDADLRNAIAITRQTLAALRRYGETFGTVIFRASMERS
jgi:hypothetical protein